MKAFWAVPQNRFRCALGLMGFSLVAGGISVKMALEDYRAYLGKVTKKPPAAHQRVVHPWRVSPHDTGTLGLLVAVAQDIDTTLLKVNRLALRPWQPYQPLISALRFTPQQPTAPASFLDETSDDLLPEALLEEEAAYLD